MKEVTKNGKNMSKDLTKNGFDPIIGMSNPD